MVIAVRYFASLAQATGCAREEIELAAGSDVTALWRGLTERHPVLAEIGHRPLAACDLTVVPWDHPLDGVREVAFLPPFSGG